MTHIHPLRDAVLTSAVLLGVVFLGTSLLYYQAQATYQKLIHQNISRVAKAAASLVDGDLHRTFQDPAQEDTEAYREAVQPLRKMLASLDNLRFLYTMVLVNDRAHFVLDATPPGDADGDGVEDHSAIMEPYDATDPALTEALTKHRVTTSKEPVRDAWGQFVSGHAPIYDSSNRPVGILGVDIDYTEYAQKLAVLKWVTLSGLIPAFLMSLLAGLVMYGVRRKALHYEMEKRKNYETITETNAKMAGVITELEENNREANLLNEMGEILQSCVNSAEVYQEVSQSIQKIFPDSKGVLYAFKPQESLYASVSGWGGACPGPETFNAEDCWALRRGQTLFAGGESGSLCCKHIANFDDGASLCIPIVAQGETLGLLSLRLVSQGLTSSKQRLVSTAAEHISLAIANIKLRETLEEQSIYDVLSGIFNRRHMEKLLDREIQIAKRKQYSVGLILFDVDCFKKYNDTLGHEAGDTLIRTLGQYLKNHVREYDIPCRLGGDEFVVIMPDTSLEVLQKRAEELREGFRQIKMLARGQTIETVSLSKGCALYPLHGSSPSELLRYADEALYRAKARPV